ncbi:MAG: hypothetical protein JSU68_10605 [Phycisphaerales bacterium]|nr:MAG: hypothetical protein JSU68_10605 [Phycisphaerales bacterium]
MTAIPAQAWEGARPCYCGDVSTPQVTWTDARGTPAAQMAVQSALDILAVLANPDDVAGLVQIEDDVIGDALLRPTALLGDGAIDSLAHRPPDVTSYVLGNWLPPEPWVDPFTGDFDPTGQYMRLDLVLQDFFNPPGPVDFVADTMLPFLYGDHPVFGFVELDMDANPDTGGETAFPQCRYLGNVCRFGGVPWRYSWLAARAARDPTDFNTEFGPVHRSGEEFHLALFGGLISQIDWLVGNDDEFFEPGEVWELTGEFLHRAHGYELFSFAFGGPGPGMYLPMCRLRFSSLPADASTMVSLVFPLTNDAAAWLVAAGEPVEPLDGNATNQASVLEALDDLALSAAWLQANPSGLPQQPIIDEWASQDPNDYLDPSLWPANLALATTYSVPPFADALCNLVWTDVWPNVWPGDFNANAYVDLSDHVELQGFIDREDGGARDADGVVNGVFHIIDFAINFTVYDVNYDGAVGPDDREFMATPGDIDLDGDVDLNDFATFAFCYGSQRTALTPGCSPIQFGRCDLDQSGSVNLSDFATFAVMFTG